MKYQFEANSKKIVVEADGMLAAMTEANKQFGSLPRGVWMAVASLNSYRWVAGNFVD
jgi:hypothetical protein